MSEGEFFYNNWYKYENKINNKIRKLKRSMPCIGNCGFISSFSTFGVDIRLPNPYRSRKQWLQYSILCEDTGFISRFNQIAVFYFIGLAFWYACLDREASHWRYVVVRLGIWRGETASGFQTTGLIGIQTQMFHINYIRFQRELNWKLTNVFVSI